MPWDRFYMTEATVLFALCMPVAGCWLLPVISTGFAFQFINLFSLKELKVQRLFAFVLVWDELLYIWCCRQAGGFRHMASNPVLPLWVDDSTDHCWVTMLSLGGLYFCVGWHPLWCSGWLCASVGRGLWRKATSRPVIRVPSASKCKIECNRHHFTPCHIQNTKKEKETPLISAVTGIHWTGASVRWSLASLPIEPCLRP